MAEFPGTSGNDQQQGTDGDDTLTGLEGDDIQRGGRGNDTYDPGPGQDIIQIEPGGGFDTVLGFETGTDTLEFSGFRNIKNFDALQPFMTTTDGDTVINVARANGSQAATGPSLTLAQSVTVEGVESLGKDDFDFTTPFRVEPSILERPVRMPFEEFPTLPEGLPDPFPRGPNPGPDPPNPDWWLIG
jgi:Ca2+-binding RTX toxin-like protein